MFRKLFSLISLLMFSASVFGAEEVVDQTSFFLKLNKPGVTDYYFADYGSENRKDDNIVFTLPSSGHSDAYFSFVWQIYYTGNVSISMTFSSDHPEYMLHHTVDSAIAGLNYDAWRVSETSDGAEAAESLLCSAPGTVYILPGTQVDSTTGISGRADIHLSLDIPSTAMEGQYKGDVTVQITAE